MHPGPDHFLVRPGAKDGKPGTIVPLIAVDQLPDWMQLVGVPRALDTEQTIGLTNLGIIDKEDGDVYEVRLHHVKIRAILDGTEKTGSSSSSDRVGRAKDTSINGPSPSEAKTRPELSRKETPVVVNLSSLLASKVTSRKQTASSSQGEPDGNDSEPGNISPPSSASASEEVTARMQEQDQHHPGEPMLGASRHNVIGTKVAGTAARGGAKPIRPHMTQAASDKPYPSVAQHNSTTRHKTHSVGNSNSNSINKNKKSSHPDTVFCRHWCHHGSCKWGWECRYQHRMPTTFEGLREVGLKDLPTWYLLIMGGGGGPRFPSMATDPGFGLNSLFGGLEVGNSAGGTNMTPPSQYLTITPTRSQPDTPAHHPSEVDLRLMRGRMSALLSGPGATSHRQRLRQVKEMRDILVHGSRTQAQAQAYHQASANLHTSASVAANTADTRRQAERPQYQSQHMQVSDLPVAARAGRVRAAVIDDGSSEGVDEVRPEDSVSLAGREGVYTRVEGERHSLSGSGDVGGQLPEKAPAPKPDPEEKLVDI